MTDPRPTHDNPVHGSIHGIHRVLDATATASLADYTSKGGGMALEVARGLEPEKIIEVISAAGLRGRGGGGFPTGLKWNTVAHSWSDTTPTTVVVNAAEGEPGTFKDRAIIRRNPYRLLEGAAIAARAVRASAIRIGIKASFVREIGLLDRAITQATDAGWFDGIDVAMVLGAGYLFGEETAMLEVIEGRQPFPRVTPPFRRGIDEDDPTRSAADINLAEIGGSSEPPALVNNVETLSNVPLIVANGAEWFRSLGTQKSPGTVVVTVTGDTNRAGVAEVPMGTTLAQVIDLVGWGMAGGRGVGLVVSGTANPLIHPSALDTPLTYEDASAAGFGIGSCGFIVFDDTTDPVAVAQGISRFLAVESCGQCEACKLDGTELSILLDRLSHSKASGDDIVEIRRRQGTVSVGARCNLARQQEAVVGSLLSAFEPFVAGHELHGTAAAIPSAPPIPVIAPIEDISAGTAFLDATQESKNLDWSYGGVDSETSPAARFGDTPFLITEPIVHPHRQMWVREHSLNRMHPLDQIDEAHNDIDAALHDLRHGDEVTANEAAARLNHLVRVHIDVTQRILYPTVRRDCGPDGDELVETALKTERRIGESVEGIIAEASECRESSESVNALGNLLRQHVTDETAILALLRERLDEQQKKVLMDALAEAHETSLV